MLHTVSGHNFHGHYQVKFRGPDRAFLLSPSQARRYRHALCPHYECKCGGGYGDGPCRDGAHMCWAYLFTSPELRNLGLCEAEIKASGEDPDALILIPAVDPD